MGTAKIKINPAMQLGSPESQFRLNQIDKIRAKGVGDHVSLPQIAVCGDQSTGKSSVMERLTHIPFPRRDGICTRFATEIILRHSDGPRQIVASIRADTSRKPESQEILQGYRKIMSDFSDLPAIIEEVSALMGLRSVENPNGSAFALDALRIEVSGSTGLHLTIVDLPGLISVPNEEQSDEDVEMVHRLVESYLQSSRTIILAVVQAGNDIANQPILRKAREFDPNGLRTVGIITKPDLINDGTEYQIARLVNNEGNVKLKLGFFILKNPSPKDMEAGYNAETFDRIESTFFAQTAWRRHAIHTDRVGISKLKEFVQVLLHEHIEREIPKVREELKKKLFDLELKQKGLGKARPTLNDIRSFLTERSMRFHQLAQDSLQGHYLGSEADFFQHETRLRALVHRENFTFAENMRVEGSKRIVVESKPSSSSDSIDESIDDRQTEQIKVTQKEMLNWVKEVYHKTRGLELPGNYNHSLLAELFQVQASRWRTIAERHVEKILGIVKDWLRQALISIVQDEELRRELLSMCNEKLDRTAAIAYDELQKLWRDEERQPITYNHYFTDNIQKARHNIQAKAVKNALQAAIQEDWNGKLHISNQAEDIDRLTSALQSRVLVNMDDRACNEALEGMEAYYKVSRKTFVDNISRQVIERHILDPLPMFFSPVTVAELPDAEVVRIGSEPEAKKATRESLSASAECLRVSLKELSANPHD